jgi:basic amino acid/polyamine antiporter, APA family
MTSTFGFDQVRTTSHVRAPRRLLMVLGVVFGLSATIGTTIGTGILRTPGEVAALVPNVPLFLAVWIVGGLYATLGANSFAELGAMMPDSGGFTVFVHRAMGAYPSFVIGWADWLVNCAGVSLSAIVVGEYMLLLFGGPADFAPAVGCAVVIALALLQWIGVKSGSRTQTITAVAKTLVFLALVVACLGWGGGAGFREEATRPLPGGVALAATLTLAMQAVLFTFDGYYASIYFSGEVRNPGRDIPRMLFGGVAALTFLYLLINVAFVSVLSISAMAGDPLVAASASRVVFGVKGDTVMRTLIIVSLLSAMNASQMIASRVIYRLGEKGFVPNGDYVTRGGTPLVGLVLSTLVCLGFAITGTFQIVLAITAFFFVSEYTLAFASLLILRKKEPDTPRPFRAKGHPWTTAGVFLLSIAFLTAAVAADTRNSMYSLVLLAVSFPIYRWMRR